MKLTASDLMSLEEYAHRRQAFRHQLIQHQQPRYILLGEHVRLQFEDRLTIQYQVQEILWRDKISASQRVEDILLAHNPRIPDGHNWKATLVLDCPATADKKIALQKLTEIERKTWVQVNGAERIYPVCDKGMAGEDSDKASGVPVLRFELHHDDISLLRQGAPILIGIDHPEYQARVTLTTPQHQALVADLD